MIDLHTHSTFSDGSDTPEQLVEAAERSGCTTIALTDHDTVTGISRASDRADQLGLRLIAGVELSCHIPRRTVHILGYFLDPDDPTLNERLATQRNLRNERNARLVGRLNELGVSITIDDVLRHAGEESVGRPHVAAALVELGHASSIDDAFARLLGEGAPGYVERQELTAEDGIRWITDAGGVAVWAHPLTPARFQDNDISADLELLTTAGLGGLECWYSRYELAHRKRLAKTANRFGLIASGGSDYHGTFKVGLELGRGQGDLVVPADTVDALESAAKQSKSN